jgi:predicted Zn-dependent protease with MMP-like domain
MVPRRRFGLPLDPAPARPYIVRDAQPPLAPLMARNDSAFRFNQPPSLADLEEIAAQAYASLPPEITRNITDVVIRVEEFPDEETEQEMDLESPFDLLGLYRGVSLDRKSVGDISTDVDMIFLYRRPLLDYWCESGEDLTGLVRHLLVHEIGHHFGFSDEDMERLEAAADTEEHRLHS